MGKKNVVYLLIGQRGSGKSYYAKRLLEKQPKLSVISRDEIIKRMCGSTSVSPYTGVHFFAQKMMHRLLRRKLSTQSGLSLILDTWTGDGEERMFLIRELRMYGAARIVGLYFITPVEVVNSWFWKKPEIAKIEEMEIRKEKGLTFFNEDAPARDHKIFHALTANIDSNGFDEVVRINPLDQIIDLI